MRGEGKGWYVHHRMKWTIIISSYKWYQEHEFNILTWLESEGILVHNEIPNRIFLYSDAQMNYFKLRWG